MSVTAAEWIQGYLTMQEKILELETMVPDSEDHIYVTPVTFTNVENYVCKFCPNKIIILILAIPMPIYLRQWVFKNRI